jgi:hypothetical protein
MIRLRFDVQSALAGPHPLRHVYNAELPRQLVFLRDIFDMSEHMTPDSTTALFVWRFRPILGCFA